MLFLVTLVLLLFVLILLSFHTCLILDLKTRIKNWIRSSKPPTYSELDLSVVATVNENGPQQTNSFETQRSV